jgi:hypothetical protein
VEGRLSSRPRPGSFGTAGSRGPASNYIEEAQPPEVS